MTAQEIESSLIARLKDLKYSYRADINSRSALEMNFRTKFEDLNRVKLTDGEFARLLDEIITTDVFPLPRSCATSTPSRAKTENHSTTPW